MLNMCSKQDFIPFTLITCYSHCDTDTHNHGSQEFIPNFSFSLARTLIQIVQMTVDAQLKHHSLSFTVTEWKPT